MWLTPDGKRISGDEIELPDEATVSHGWLLTILDESRNEVGREVLYRGTPTEDMQMYWIKRYNGKFCVLNRITILEEDLPFTDDPEDDEYLQMELEGYHHYLEHPEDPAFHMDE